MRRRTRQDDKQKLEIDVGEDKTGTGVKKLQVEETKRQQKANEGFQKEKTEREGKPRMWRHKADKLAAGQHGHVNGEQQEGQEKKQTREVRRGVSNMKPMPEETQGCKQKLHYA